MKKIKCKCGESFWDSSMFAEHYRECGDIVPATAQKKLSNREQGYINAIQKRADHLSSRIASSIDKPLSYDKHELSALTWAINNLLYFKTKQ